MRRVRTARPSEKEVVEEDVTACLAKGSVWISGRPTPGAGQTTPPPSVELVQDELTLVSALAAFR